MKKLIENAAALLKVKTLVTLAIVAVFGVMALQGRVPEGTLSQTVMVVVAFYFGTQHERGAGR